MKWLAKSAAVSLVFLAVVSPVFAGATEARDAAALARDIDRLVQQRLDAEQVKPSPRAADAEFIRRVYLDIAGVIPPAEKVAAFLDCNDASKRSKLIDELLADPKYGRRQADIWSALLFPRTSDNKRLSAEPLHQWLEKNFNDNKPWDKLATDLLTATGEQEANGTVTFFIANNSVDKVTDEVCRLFLGVQLQCAQCHNHPFTGWKREEYWGMAAFFMKVNSPKKVGKQGPPAIAETPNVRPRNLPESAKTVPAKFLMGEAPKLNPRDPYRPAFAAWLTSPNNPFFARAVVNRTWGQLFGRGLVNPIDNMHDGNPPSHPELLAELTEQFKANGFDVKYLVRAICNSQAYQRTSKPADGNEADAVLFSHMNIKALSAEQLFDSLAQVAGGVNKAEDKRGKGMKAAGNNTPRAQFVNFFATQDEPEPTEYSAGIPQALRLMNSGQFNVNAAGLQFARSGQTPAQIAGKLYLATLARRPSAAETARVEQYVRDNEPKTAYSDVLWALVNSSEFTLNH